MIHHHLFKLCTDACKDYWGEGVNTFLSYFFRFHIALLSDPDNIDLSLTLGGGGKLKN